mmetsp:Transcript_6660/g.11631  ORF Transcript_6660/g.11631 Transcript_6660/m.11631 type:complete len:90 (-) Transcript_6660:270-539(-)
MCRNSCSLCTASGDSLVDTACLVICELDSLLAAENAKTPAVACPTAVMGKASSKPNLAPSATAKGWQGKNGIISDAVTRQYDAKMVVVG